MVENPSYFPDPKAPTSYHSTLPPGSLPLGNAAHPNFCMSLHVQAVSAAWLRHHNSGARSLARRIPLSAAPRRGLRKLERHAPNSSDSLCSHLGVLRCGKFIDVAPRDPSDLCSSMPSTSMCSHNCSPASFAVPSPGVRAHIEHEHELSAAGSSMERVVWLYTYVCFLNSSHASRNARFSTVAPLRSARRRFCTTPLRYPHGSRAKFLLFAATCCQDSSCAPVAALRPWGDGMLGAPYSCTYLKLCPRTQVEGPSFGVPLPPCFEACVFALRPPPCPLKEAQTSSTACSAIFC